jgi:hypothetical protein
MVNASFNALAISFELEEDEFVEFFLPATLLINPFKPCACTLHENAANKQTKNTIRFIKKLFCLKQSKQKDYRNNKLLKNFSTTRTLTMDFYSKGLAINFNYKFL